MRSAFTATHAVTTTSFSRQGPDIYNDLPVRQQWVAESHSVMVRIPKVGSMEIRLAPFMHEGVQLRMKGKAPGGGDVYLCLRILSGLEEPSSNGG